MSEEEKKKVIRISRILSENNTYIEDAKFIGRYIDEKLEKINKLRLIEKIHRERIKELMRRLEKRTSKIDKAIGLIYDYQINDKDNNNYKELLNVLKEK